jgi:hypothetical protein
MDTRGLLDVFKKAQVRPRACCGCTLIDHMPSLSRTKLSHRDPPLSLSPSLNALTPQEERVSAYREFDEGLAGLLRSRQLRSYPSLCMDTTASFAALSNLVNAVEARLRECSQAQALPDTIRKVGEGSVQPTSVRRHRLSATPSGRWVEGCSNRSGAALKLWQGYHSLCDELADYGKRCIRPGITLGPSPTHLIDLSPRWQVQVQEQEKLSLTAALHLERMRLDGAGDDALLRQGVETLEKRIVGVVVTINDLLEELRYEAAEVLAEESL